MLEAGGLDFLGLVQGEHGSYSSALRLETPVNTSSIPILVPGLTSIVVIA